MTSSAHTIYFLHGFLGEGRDWQEVCRHVPIPGIALDWPGHGAAGAEPVPDGGQGLMAWLEARWPARAHLVGYSMGGRVGLAFALRYPERVASLTLISASPGLEGDDVRAKRRAADAAWADRFRTGPLLEVLDDWYRQPVFASLREKPALMRTMIERRAMGCGAALADALVRWGQGTLPSLWHDLPALTMPVLGLFGERDGAYGKMAKRLALVLPSARVQIVKQAGHAVHLEQPRAVADSIVNFMETYT